jgi:hypothetical protein
MNKIITKLEKVYKVTFVRYMNYRSNTVCDNDGNYIDIGDEEFVILEHEIPFYQKFGGGIRELKFVGNVVVEIIESPKN